MAGHILTPRERQSPDWFGESPKALRLEEEGNIGYAF
jgi:hypothetical protein